MDLNVDVYILCDMDTAGLDVLASAMHGGGTNAKMANAEKVFKLPDVWWMGPYLSLCRRVSGEYPLGFKPKMIQMSDEEAKKNLADVEKYVPPGETGQRRRVEINLLQRDMRKTKTITLTYGKTDGEFLTAIYYLLGHTVRL